MSIVIKTLIGIGAFIGISALGIWIFWEQLPIRLIWPYIAQPEIPVTGEVQKITITGETAGEQTFFVYLPQGYETGNQQYRVLYHLHGAGVQESWAGYDCNGIGGKMDEMVAAGAIEPMIVVCPVDPTKFSMWSDSKDGTILASSGIIQDIIPYVDSNYRTIASKEGRAIQGFSMGGFGSAMNGFKYHHLFKAVIIWDGALHDWNTLTTNRASIARTMFSNDEAHFDDWSPWRWAEESADADIDLFMVVGTMGATRDFASRYKPFLESTGRDFVYKDSECPHNLFCMLDEYGEDAFRFLAQSFAE